MFSYLFDVHKVKFQTKTFSQSSQDISRERKLKFPQFSGPFCFLNVICEAGGVKEQEGPLSHPEICRNDRIVQ